MSIGDKLQGIINSKAAIKNSITNKGVTVPENAMLSDCPVLIDAIQQGGGSDDLVEGVDFMLVNSPFPATATLQAITGSNGDILLGASTHSFVYKFNRVSKTWEQLPFSGMFQVIKLFVDSSGNTYFYSNSESFIFKHTPNGDIVKIFKNGGNSHFRNISYDVWKELSDGNILHFPSNGNYNVYILNPTTNTLEYKDCKGTNYCRTCFKELPNGDLYIAGSDKFMTYSKNGDLWESYISPTNTPNNIFIKSSGEVFVTSYFSANPRIYMFSPSTKTISNVYTGNATNYDFSVMTEVDGVLFFSATYTSYGIGVLVFNDSTQLVQIAYNTLYDYSSGFVANGNIYLISKRNQGVLKYNRDTLTLELFATAGTVDTAIQVDGGFLLGNSTSENSGLWFFDLETNTITGKSPNNQGNGLYKGSYFYDKDNHLCFYGRQYAAYWDTSTKSLIRISPSTLPVYMNNLFMLLHRDKNGNCILIAKSNSTQGIIIHKSINDAFLITGRAYNHIAISYVPLLLISTIENTNIIKWDEDSQEATIDSWFPTGASVAIGNLRIGTNIIYNGVSKRAYILPLTAGVVALDSINDTYGIASVKIGSITRLLIV